MEALNQGFESMQGVKSTAKQAQKKKPCNQYQLDETIWVMYCLTSTNVERCHENKSVKRQSQLQEHMRVVPNAGEHGTRVKRGKRRAMSIAIAPNFLRFI